MPPMLIAYCRRCKKPDAMFYDSDNHKYACAECIRGAARKNMAAEYARDLDGMRAKQNAKVRKHYAAHSDHITELERRAHVRDPRRAMVQEAKRRARRKGLPFSITAADILVPSVCPVLGIPIHVVGGKVTDNSPSIDRITGALGYVRGNVRVISFRANSLKRDATPEELELVLEDLRAPRMGVAKCAA